MSQVLHTPVTEGRGVGGRGRRVIERDGGTEVRGYGGAEVWRDGGTEDGGRGTEDGGM